MEELTINAYGAVSAADLAKGVAKGRFNAAQLCEVAIGAIEAKDGPINAVVVRDFDRARSAAKTLDSEIALGRRGPLLGVPVTVKESHFVAGLPTTWGLAPFKGWTPDWDSTAVSRLKAAGAVILGKTNIPPGLGDVQCANPIYGRTNHPLDPSVTPGGSSGGAAAALAAGMVALELGSDIGGSIRTPSHFCGLFGHKPSFNLIPQTGHSPPGPGMERPSLGVELGVLGPMARSAGDLQLALDVLAGPDGEAAKAYNLQLPSPRRTSPEGLRVLVLDTHPLSRADREIRSLIGRAADALVSDGAELIDLTEVTDLPNLEESHSVYVKILSAVTSRGRGFTDPFTSHDWMDLLSAQDKIQRNWAKVFETVDVVLAPAFGVPAFPHTQELDWSKRRLIMDGEEVAFAPQLAWAGIASLANLPATCAPIGKSTKGLPIGMQIIGPYLEDRSTIAVAGMIEALTKL